MTEAEWLANPHLPQMVGFLVDQRGTERCLRLFACSCCRRVWDALRLDAAKRLVELSEAYADSRVTEAELQAADNDQSFAGLDRPYKGRAAVAPQLSAYAWHAIRGARWMAESNFHKSMGDVGVAQETCKDRGYDYIPT